MEDPRGRLIGGIYEAALDPCRWQAVLGDIAVSLGAEETGFVLRDLRHPDRLFFVDSGGIPESAQRAYVEHYQTVDLRLAAGRALPHGVVYRETQLVEPGTYDRSEFVNDFCRPNGVYHLLAGLDRLGDWEMVFAVNRSPDRGPFSEAEQALGQGLMGHLKRAAAIHLRLEAAGAAEQGLAASLDLLDLGVVLLDADGAVLHRNRRATELLARDDGLTVGHGGRLRTALPDQTDRLNRLIHAAIGTSDGEPPAAGVLAVDRPSLAPPWTVSVIPARQAGAVSLWPLAAAALFVTEPGRPGGPAERTLRDLWGLTVTEARLTAELSAGRGTPAEIGARLGITPETARYYLKSVFQKTGTHRQADLVALVRSTLPPLAG